MAWGLPLVVTTWALSRVLWRLARRRFWRGRHGGFPGAAGARSSRGLAWPRRRGSGESFGRLRTLLIIQVVADSFGRPVSGESRSRSIEATTRPRKSRSGLTATPCVASLATRCKSWTRPGHWGRPRHRQVRPIAQDLAHKPSQGPLGPDFYEDPGTRLVHRVHLLAEADPRGQMIDQGAAMPGVFGVSGRRHVGVNRTPRRPQPNLPQGLRQDFGPGRPRRVVGESHRQPLHRPPPP